MSKGMSPCGIVCADCEKYPAECPGCASVEGKVWWTEFAGVERCDAYDCCVNRRKLADCGKCPDCPCDALRQEDPTRSPEENARLLAEQLRRLSM